MDDFLTRMHQRQRSEMLRQSSLGLFWDRVSTYMEGRASAHMGLAAAAVVALGSALWWMPHPGTEVNVAAIQAGKPAGPVMPAAVPAESDRTAMFIIPELGFQDQVRTTPPPARLGEMLLSQHFGGGYADEARQAHGGVTAVNMIAPPDNSSSAIEGAEPAMQQNGSVEKIQKLGR